MYDITHYKKRASIQLERLHREGKKKVEPAVDIGKQFIKLRSRIQIKYSTGDLLMKNDKRFNKY